MKSDESGSAVPDRAPVDRVETSGRPAHESAEDALRKSEERYRILVENLNVGVFQSTPTGTFVHANRAVAEMAGYASVKEFLLQPPSCLYADPADRERLIQALTRDGEVRNLALRSVRKDGTQYWISLNAVLQRDHAGRPEQILGIVTDITQHRRDEEALHESQERFQAILDNTSLLVYVKDPDGRLTFVNRQFEALFGVPRTQLLGKTSHDLMGSNDADAHRANDLFVMARRTPVTIEEANEEPDGRHLYLSTKFPILDAAGEVKGVCGVSADITERKRVEEALRESEERYRSLIELSPEAVIVHSDGRLTYVNRAGSRIFGASRPEDMIGRPIKDFVHPDYWEAVRARVSRVQDDHQPARLQELVFLRADGRPIDVETAGVPITFAGKTASLTIIRDITARKLADQEKAQLEAQLQQAQRMESVGRLAGGVAHDFNNMLGVILGHAEIALDGVDPLHPLHADLIEIRTAAKRSADLTRQLLAFARKQTIAPRVSNLNEAVAGSLKMLGRLIGEDIRIQWQPAPNLWPVKTDPSQIDQILTNLCVNARDAIAGVGTITIGTGNRAFNEADGAALPGIVPGDYVRLEVTDDGCGIDTETLGHIFEPFFTTKRVGAGTGLGLASVYGAVNQNGGHIEARSQPGSGTTFTIHLPRARETVEQPGAEGAAGPAMRGHETILVVEDEPSILKLTTTVLQRSGYTVLAAGTPGEAIRLAGQYEGPIHLLMTDVVMPEMDGQALARQLLTFRPHVKSLFMSGYTADVVANHGVLNEGVSFLQKPFSIEAVAAKVRETLDSEWPAIQPESVALSPGRDDRLPMSPE